ncbi:hypothetical protein H0H87_004386 [Tephrocybe sp. NHM501043]|nr:hypothetical protein H0H87_004386 [Tephrocybe sp. NHM501043]
MFNIPLPGSSSKSTPSDPNDPNKPSTPSKRSSLISGKLSDSFLPLNPKDVVTKISQGIPSISDAVPESPSLIKVDAHLASPSTIHSQVSSVIKTSTDHVKSQLPSTNILPHISSPSTIHTEVTSVIQTSTESITSHLPSTEVLPPILPVSAIHTQISSVVQTSAETIKSRLPSLEDALPTTSSGSTEKSAAPETSTAPSLPSLTNIHGPVGALLGAPSKLPSVGNVKGLPLDLPPVKDLLDTVTAPLQQGANIITGTTGSVVSVVSDSLPPQLSSGTLGSLPSLPGKVGAELYNLTNVALSSDPLSTKFSNIASSPLIPQIPGVHLISEVTPLLNSVKRIPWFQVFILLFLQVIEPLTSHVVSPITPGLIRASVGNIGTDEQLEYIAGLFVHGNAGVIKGMMAEMVDTADLARIYAFTPLAYSAGAAVGPLINDLLPNSTQEQLPDPCTASGTAMIPNLLLYLFATSVPTVLSIASFVLTFLFLKETVKSPAPVSSLFRAPSTQADLERVQDAASIISGLHQTVTHKIQDGVALGGAVASAVAARLPVDPRNLFSVRALLANMPVIISVGNFAGLSLVDITFQTIQPLYLASPMSLGGIGLPPDQVDKILPAFKVLNGVIQMMFFKKIYDHLGPRNTFRYGIASAIPLFLMFPVTTFLAKTAGHGILLWLALGAQVVLPIGLSLAFGEISS